VCSRRQSAPRTEAKGDQDEITATFDASKQAAKEDFPELHFWDTCAFGLEDRIGADSVNRLVAERRALACLYQGLHSLLVL